MHAELDEKREEFFSKMYGLVKKFNVAILI